MKVRHAVGRFWVDSPKCGHRFASNLKLSLNTQSEQEVVAVVVPGLFCHESLDPLHLDETSVQTLGAYALTAFGCDLETGAGALSLISTTIVSGRRDRLASVRGGRALAGAIPESTYIELPAVGHMIQVEAPEHVHRLLDDLISSV
ncbi:alpha/beta hydrolase [Aeromicrobium sp.]|uniref:alpha/beta fold hydrolase n=1 Tax=Aeromicrobium sp. TaxID=1871063 RepID=UPI0030BE57B7